MCLSYGHVSVEGSCCISGGSRAARSQPGAAAVIAAALLVFALLTQDEQKEVRRNDGDLAGYFLQMCELAMLAVICVCRKDNIRYLEVLSSIYRKGKTMRVVFIRHLCTPGNEKRQYIGRTDEDLSEQAVEEFYQRQEKSTGGLYPSGTVYRRKSTETVHQTAGLIYPEWRLSQNRCSGSAISESMRGRHTRSLKMSLGISDGWNPENDCIPGRGRSDILSAEERGRSEEMDRQTSRGGRGQCGFRRTWRYDHGGAFRAG